jgi:hypothetical protein
LNETAAVLHFGAKLKSRRTRLLAEGRQRTDSALRNPAVIPAVSAADAVLHQAAAREQVGPNRGGRRQKFVQEIQGDGVDLFPGARSIDGEAAVAEGDLRREMRREIIPERDLISRAVLRDAILVQQGVLGHEAQVPRTGVAACYGIRSVGAAARRAGCDHQST